jgi:hypothetical protein
MEAVAAAMDVAREYLVSTGHYTTIDTDALAERLRALSAQGETDPDTMARKLMAGEA